MKTAKISRSANATSETAPKTKDLSPKLWLQLTHDVGEMSVANWADKMIYTAVAQLSSLLLLSLESNALQGPFLEAALESANAALPRWPEPYEDAAHFLSAEDTESSLAPSSSPLRGDEFTSRAAPTGRVVSLRSRSSCRPRRCFAGITRAMKRRSQKVAYPRRGQNWMWPNGRSVHRIAAPKKTP